MFIKIFSVSLQRFAYFGCEGSYLSYDTDNLNRSQTILKGCLTTF